MNWIWLNLPLGLLIVLAVAGIPMWLVIKHPDTRPESPARRAAYRPDLVPAYAVASQAGPAGPQPRGAAPVRQHQAGTPGRPQRAAAGRQQHFAAGRQQHAGTAGDQRRAADPRQASVAAGAR